MSPNATEQNLWTDMRILVVGNLSIGVSTLHDNDRGDILVDGSDSDKADVFLENRVESTDSSRNTLVSGELPYFRSL